MQNISKESFHSTHADIQNTQTTTFEKKTRVVRAQEMKLLSGFGNLVDFAMSL